MTFKSIIDEIENNLNKILDELSISDVKYIVEDKYKINIPLTPFTTYRTKNGEKTMYYIRFFGSRRNPENLPVFKNLIKDNVMTLDRKKQKVQEFLEQV